MLFGYHSRDIGIAEGVAESLSAKFEVLLPHLDERQRRLLLVAESRSFVHGRIRAVARAAGVREATVSQGVTELDSGAWVHRLGAGRKRVTETNPDERGDPMSPRR